MRDKIAKITCKNCGEQLGMLCQYPTMPRCEFCKLNTNQILTLISEEIEQVGKPEFYKDWGGECGEAGFEQCRQKILALLR